MTRDNDIHKASEIHAKEKIGLYEAASAYCSFEKGAHWAFAKADEELKTERLFAYRAGHDAGVAKADEEIKALKDFNVRLAEDNIGYKREIARLRLALENACSCQTRHAGWCPQCKALNPTQKVDGE
jgi:hypothetical protein